ncbi:hypothetical protein CcaCcLH18_01905 [Colletotrichum camelliae]|nr:hypothetical protein CcaCcLH18_01905 [Colletotrichum camelliae]
MAHDTQPGHAGENDIESSSPNRIYALLRRHGLIEITERVGASDLKFRVVDDRAHDALVKLLRENFIRIISGGFQIQEPPRPQRPTPSQNMQHLGLGLIAASQRVEAMSSIIIELWDIYALIPLASAMETAGQCCGGEPSKDTKLELGKTENSPPAEVATLMVGMLRGAENMACHMGRLSKEDSRACGHLAWHSEYLRGMLRELLVLGWYMERGRDDLVERWRLDHDMGRPQPSGHALR